MFIPQILIVDDLFGRTVRTGHNVQRANLCGQYLIKDITGDEVGRSSVQHINQPVAEAFFCRGQTPSNAKIGDLVENDLVGTMDVIRSGWSNPKRQFNWAMVLLDLCFYTGEVTKDSDIPYPGMPEGQEGDADPLTCFGLELLKAIQLEMPDLPVVILSSMPRKEVSHEFSSRGASAFIARDQGDPATLRLYLERYGLIPDKRQLIVGHSKSLLLALRDARRLAATDQHILIRGEAGTGKELFASYIHELSDRNSNTFEAVSLPAIPFNLVEDALFGHVKGAFDGAVGDNAIRKGAFENADKGTLFLDEIGDTPPEVQPKLLRAIQNGEVQRLGADTISKADVRIISATNIDIESRVAAGEGFRQDLLDRLRVGGTILLPPLRHRKEDIKLLTEKFICDAQKLNKDALARQIDPKALEKLTSYEWPGNLRELQQVIFEAINRYPDVEYLVPTHINIHKISLTVPPSSSSEKTGIFSSEFEEKKTLEEDSNIQALIDRLNTFQFDSASSELVGGLPKLQKAFSLLLARYLAVVLNTNMQNRTVQNPKGEVRIQRCINIMVGEGNLTRVTGSKAADMIKNLLNIKEPVIQTLLEDPDFSILREALDKALSLRPKRTKSSQK